MSKIKNILFHNPYIKILTALILIFIIGFLIVLRLTSTHRSADEPYISAGANMKSALAPDDATYFFEDPIKTPSDVPVYPIYAAPEKLFSEDAVVAIAANTGFTNRATAQQATRGYIYTESGSTLSLDVLSGTLTYAIPKERYPSADQAISIEDALARAKDFVSKVGFANPVYTWSIDNIHLYSQAGDRVIDATFVDTQTHYHVTISMQIGNSPFYLPQEQFVKVHADGSIIGAFLWYPFIDFTREENIDVLSYADATTKVRLGEANYTIGRLSPETILSSSTIGYFVPDAFMNNSGQEGFITEPAYVFSNKDVTIYVSAVE